MKNDIDTLREFAALHAAGALDREQAIEFSRLLAENPEARAEFSSFSPVIEALARSVPPSSPLPPALKSKIMGEVEKQAVRRRLETQLKSLAPSSNAGFAFLNRADETDWIPLPVRGAYVKLLSFDESTGHATVLGKLDAGARYPAHHHIKAEDIFMLSGDLHIGDKVIHAMDFHHADAGTDHGVNWSEHGCVLVAVLSKEDLLQQFAAA